MRLQATLGPDQCCMIGTWYDAHGNDEGIVLVRPTGTQKLGDMDP